MSEPRHEVVAAMSSRPPRFFGRRRWLVEQENRRLRLALHEALDFVTSELDPEPHPWEAYVTSPEAQFQLRVEQRFAAASSASSPLLPTPPDGADNG